MPTWTSKVCTEESPTEESCVPSTSRASKLSSSAGEEERLRGSMSRTVAVSSSDEEKDGRALRRRSIMSLTKMS